VFGRTQGRALTGLGAEDGVKRHRIRKVEPAPEPFAEVVLRIGDLWVRLGQEADESGAVECGVLQVGAAGGSGVVT